MCIDNNDILQLHKKFSGEDSIDVTVDRFDPGREVLVNNGMVFTYKPLNKASLFLVAITLTPRFYM